MLVTIGTQNAPVCAKSTKQKINTRSSTEAELVALDESLLHLLWFTQIMAFLGYPQSPTFVYQDNKSTITVCEAGHSKNGRLKHMAVRWHFIQGKIQDKTIKLEYMPTNDMIADIMTKTIQGSKWETLKKLLLNDQK